MINRKPQLQKPPRRQNFHFRSRKQMKHINLPSPSMKTAQNVDGSKKNDIPSMKTVKNVDGSMKYDIPSMKTAKNMDGSMKYDFPSMKTAKNMDGRMNYHSHPQKGVVLRTAD